MAEEHVARSGGTLGRTAVAGIPLVLVPALGAVQGGFHPDAWVWAGTLAAWACAVALAVGPDAGALRSAWPWAAAAAALLAWTLLSGTWSVLPAQSVLEARRTLVYAAVVLALILLAHRGGPRLLGAATYGGICVVLAYALLLYLGGRRRQDTFESFLLSRPLGYANAAGVLAAIGIVLGLGIAAATASPRRRAAAAAGVPPLTLALLFSDSTASWLALGVGVAVVLVLEPTPQRLVVAAALAAPPAALLVALGHYSRYADSAAASPRLSGAVLLGAAALAAAVAGAAAARFGGGTGPATGPRLRRALLTAAICLALGGAAVVARSGATEPRASYWHVAWHDEVLRHPVLGSGAGTFGRAWVESGKAATLGGALDAHSLYLETLAELGPVGLLLLAALLLAPLRGAVRRRGAPFVPAAVGAYAAFLVHAGLDWDWEMPAVVVAALCCAAVVVAAGPREPRPVDHRLRALLIAVAVVLAGCAIAGARSGTEPSAAPFTSEAPQSGASPALPPPVRGYLP